MRWVPWTMPTRTPDARPRAVLICHAESRLNRETMAAWLGSFSDLVGIVSIEERADHTRRRMRAEIKRAGWLRFVDVLAFRLYYAARLAARDDAWMNARLDDLRGRFPEPTGVEVLRTDNPSSEETAAFLRRLQPDFVTSISSLMVSVTTRTAIDRLATSLT